MRYNNETSLPCYLMVGFKKSGITYSIFANQVSVFVRKVSKIASHAIAHVAK